MVALEAKDEAEAFDIGVVELPVPRGRALGLDQSLGFEEADLRDADIGEICTYSVQHLADAQVVPGTG